VYILFDNIFYLFCTLFEQVQKVTLAAMAQNEVSLEKLASLEAELK
jgi:hypothetical protein